MTQRMSTFTDNELEYLRSQRLARLATADLHGAPHVVPLGLHLSADGRAIEVSGRGFATTKKYRNIKANPQVAILVDDLANVDPWTPRGIEIRGIAQLHEAGDGTIGPNGADQAWARIIPQRVVSWGIDSPAQRQARSIAPG